MLFYLDNIYYEKVFVNIELLIFWSYLIEVFYFYLERVVKIMEFMFNINGILICLK